MEGETLRIVIADDSAVVRAIVARQIEAEPGLELVGSAEDGETAADLVARERPDVVVLDWVMPRGGGTAAARRIAAESPATAIIALTGSDTPEAELDMLRAGARSFLLKDDAPAELIPAIRQAMRL